MKISDIIPTIQRTSLLRCLKSLYKQDYDELIIVKDKSKCVANARNRGIRMAKGDILIFIDDDIIVSPDFIEKGKQFFQKYQDTDLMQGGISGKIQTSKRFMFVGANLWVKKEVAKKVLFYEGFKISGHEDTDFGWRICDKGYKIRYNPNCIVYHFEKPKSIFTKESDDLLKKRHPKRYKKLKEENNSWL
jgi:GT2 family glycosyltransferase